MVNTTQVCGGELFSYLRCYGKFNLDTTLFYITEIITAIAYLHSLNIIYRLGVVYCLTSC